MNLSRWTNKDFIKKIVCMLIIVLVLPTFLFVRNVSAETRGTVCNVTSYLNVRESASTSSRIVGKLYAGASVEVIDTSVAGWYKIKYGSINGYCSSDYIQITNNTTSNTPSQDADFEASIASFPESYKAGLRSLHASHPHWTFTAINCGDWNSALSLETRNGVSLVPLTSDRSWLDLNERGVKDSPNWVNASDAIIAYYLDPRNMLSEGNVFQFMNLCYTANSIEESAIAGAMNGTFLNNNGNFTVDGSTPMNSAQAFATAGNESGVNPIFLVTHVIQECGVNGGTSSNGTNGVYNLYNIGAYSDVNNAAVVGLNFAANGLNPTFNSTYNIPWNTLGKSCVNGARWIADNYIYKGQNTLYFMRFNLSSSSNYNRGSHQYMTALQSCSSESSRMFNSYKRAQRVETAINFSIPVYSNMPATACPYPAQMNATGYPDPSSTPTSNNPYNRNPERLGAFITRLYLYCLDREPDQGGYNYWYNLTMRLDISGFDLANGFLYSPEFQNQNLSNEEFVRRLYRIYMDREPETEGFNYWVGLLNRGIPRSGVIDYFYISPEFAERCNETGIRPC